MDGYFKLAIFTVAICVPDQVDDVDQDVAEEVIDDVHRALLTFEHGLPEGWKIEVKD